MGKAEDIRSDPRTIDTAWMASVLDDAGVSRGATLAECRFDGFVGTGQTGCNGRFSLTWSESATNDANVRPATVMGKFPSLDETARATGFGGSAYVTEYNFYSRVAVHREGARTEVPSRGSESGGPTVLPHHGRPRRIGTR